MTFYMYSPEVHAQIIKALLEALKGLQKQYAEHPDAFWDWSQARAAIKLAEGEDV